MKILYLSAVSLNISGTAGHLYNGCGWIGSLIKGMSTYNNVDIGVSFFGKVDKPLKRKVNGTTFYVNPEPQQSKFGIICSLFTNKYSYDKIRLDLTEKVIDDFKPDIIQVFGSEDCFGLITRRTNIPVVIHLQGIINPIFNAFLPQAMNWNEFPNIAMNIRHRLLRLFDKNRWVYYKKREIEIFKINKYFIGRTHWDKMLTQTFNREAAYFECWEILRDCFYDNEALKISPKKLTLTSTISNVSYKGYDVILKTAEVLKKFYNIEFEWHVFGGINSQFFEKKYNISSKENNIVLRGVASPETIKDQILRSTAFVHLSYIDNSSNSVSEAMILGCPVVTTHVGGLASLIENGCTGYIVPANDPFATANSIFLLYEDPQINLSMGIKAKAIALRRHNIDDIIETMYKIYDKIILK